MTEDLKKEFFKKFTRDGFEVQLCADGEQEMWGVVHLPFKGAKHNEFQETEVRPIDVWEWIEEKLKTTDK